VGCSTGRPISTRRSSIAPDGSTSAAARTPHLGYGGYWLDASLAKQEIELIFNAIADAMPGIAKATHPIPPPLRLDQRHQTPRRQPPGLKPSRLATAPTVNDGVNLGYSCAQQSGGVTVT
jgi:hypothetical protein